MGAAGSWIGIAVIAAILTLAITDVILKMPDPWDWLLVLLVFFATLIYGVVRSSRPD